MGRESESTDAPRTIVDIATQLVGAPAALLERLAAHPELFRAKFAVLAAHQRVCSEPPAAGCHDPSDLLTAVENVADRFHIVVPAMHVIHDGHKNVFDDNGCSQK